MKIYWLKYSQFKFIKKYWDVDCNGGYVVDIQIYKLLLELKVHEKMSYEKTTKFMKLNIITGYDENIKFFFNISKLHGLQISFLNRLFNIYYL